MKGSPAHVIAGCFALAAFAVAVIAGLASGNDAGSILIRALVAMLLCYPIGLVIGMVCQRVVEDFLRAQEAALEAKAVPDDSEPPVAQVADQNAEDAEQSKDPVAA